MSGDRSVAGLPEYSWRVVNDNSVLLLEIKLQEATLNKVVVLVDEKLVANENWRRAMVSLARKVR